MANGRSLISPPLRVIDNNRLIVNIPKNWKIAYQDTPSTWNRRSYDVTLMQLGRSSRTIVVEVLLNDMGLATRHGDMSGSTFTTSSGLRGILNRENDGYNRYDWYLAIPNKRRTDVVIIRIVRLTPFPGHTRFAYAIYRGVHFTR
jgi:hypothetical protein